MEKVFVFKFLATIKVVLELLVLEIFYNSKCTRERVVEDNLVFSQVIIDKVVI